MLSEQRFDVRHAIALAALLAVSLASPACSARKVSQSDVDETPEQSFAEQAEAVRAGKSVQIRLDHESVEDRDLDHLDALEDNLRRINLSHTHITDAGLARIAQMSKLVQLRLASDRVTDAGLECLKKLEDLRHLHLIDAPVSDAGLEHLHALKALESLYLDGTHATDAGMSKLVEALPAAHLHFDGGHHRVDPQARDHRH
jgi:hypothetical protein